MKDQVVVITGASSGIGASLATMLAKRGAKLVLVARREKELTEVASRCGTKAVPVVADVTRRADVKRVVAEALKRHGHVDVWINNAGRGISRLPSALTDEDLDDMMQVNAKAAMYAMQEILPHFQERNAGHVINVSSMLGRVPFALVRAAYSASKAFLNSLTASFRMEVHATHPGIQISLVSPGVVATEFGVHALHGGPDSRMLPNSQTADEVAEVIAKVIETRAADAYTRPEGRKMVAGYYAAEDLDEVESKPPFAMPAR
ncbi:MAG TPA: SDR family NAD(P)-dependent oxidoreductase [Polyangiaceae bacterium]